MPGIVEALMGTAQPQPWQGSGASGSWGGPEPGRWDRLVQGLLATGAITPSDIEQGKGLVQGLIGAATLPGDAMRGEVNVYPGMTTPETIQRAADFGSLAMTGGIGVPAQGLELGSSMRLPLYHGSPTKGLRSLTPSERGPLGPGVYTTPASNVAQRYAGEEGRLYTLPERERDIYAGAGDRWSTSGYEGFKQDQQRLIDAAEPDKRDAVAALVDKTWGEGYSLYARLRQLYGSDEAAHDLFKRAGFEGLSGQVDGPETLLFGEQRLPGIRAYHGSPHSFDQFELSPRTIGTGEGAQAYGHGLYFAGNEGVAKAYRDALRDKGDVILKNEFREGALVNSPRSHDRYAASLILEANGDIERAKELGRQAAKIDPKSDIVRRANDIINDPRATFRIVNDNPGSMYEVDIAADPEHFLDWDKSLSQQSEHVSKALEGLGFAPNKQAVREYDDALLAALQDRGPATLPKQPSDPTGGAIYEHSNLVPGEYRNPAAASAALRDAGIPGIKYLDQGSRAAGAGTSNYVLFDDKMVSILRKYGMPGMIGTAAGAEMAHKLLNAEANGQTL